LIEIVAWVTDLSIANITSTACQRPMASFIHNPSRKHFFVHDELATHFVFERILPENFEVDEEYYKSLENNKK
jgi:hypothetical protein